MADGVDARTVTTAVLLASATLVGVEVLGSAYVAGVDGPCDPGLDDRVPRATFDARAEDGNLTVSLADGTRFTRAETRRLLVVVEDADTGRVTRLNWRAADASFDREARPTYPVEPGDSVTIRPTQLGFGAAPGDAVRVEWSGRPRPLPGYCPNDGPTPVIDRTIAELRVGAGA